MQTQFEQNLIAAQNGEIEAMYNVAIDYAYGNGVESDFGLFGEWIRLAASKGHPRSKFELGFIYYDRQEYQEAVKWFNAAADDNIPDACVNLGLCYQFQLGVEQNYKIAMDLYIKAAQLGSGLAYNNIGFMYESGHGVLPDSKKAFKYYTLAVERNVEHCRLNLSLMCLNGNGTTKDVDKAIHWCYDLAEAGDRKAQGILAMIYMEKQEYNLAAKWSLSASEEGFSKSQIVRGYLHLIGKGGYTKDFNIAREWFDKAKSQGEPMADLCLQQLERMESKKNALKEVSSILLEELAGQAGDKAGSELWDAIIKAMED